MLLLLNGLYLQMASRCELEFCPFGLKYDVSAIFQHHIIQCHVIGFIHILESQNSDFFQAHQDHFFKELLLQKCWLTFEIQALSILVIIFNHINNCKMQIIYSKRYHRGKREKLTRIFIFWMHLWSPKVEILTKQQF